MRRTQPKIVKSLIKTALGPLEEKVLRTMCSMGRATVRDVVLALDQPFAYTTVMTTMDRLYQKGLLRRKTNLKSYIYYPVMTTLHFEEQVVQDLINALLTYRERNSSLLATKLVEVIGKCDVALLDEIEWRIQVLRMHRPVDSGGADSPSLALGDYWPLGIS